MIWAPTDERDSIVQDRRSARRNYKSKGITVSFGLDSGNKETLEDSKIYDVVMPLKEWDTRFIRVMSRPTEGGLDTVAPGGKSFSYEIEPYTFTDAVVTYLTSATNQELTIEEVIANVAESPGAKLHILW